MTETRNYELTEKEVLEICEALKFQADDLDHKEGSRADIKVWAAKAASLWALIDKFQLETPGIYGVPPSLPELARRKGSPSRPDTPSLENGQVATAKSIAGKNFLPAAFIFLWTCFGLLDPHMTRYTILGKLLIGIISGLLLIWIGSKIAGVFRSYAPKYANYAGIGLYWFFILNSLLYIGIVADEIYSGSRFITRFFGVGGALSLAAVNWVIAVGARRALTGRGQTLSSE